jgi:hypothetical protein
VGTATRATAWDVVGIFSMSAAAAPGPRAVGVQR